MASQTTFGTPDQPTGQYVPERFRLLNRSRRALQKPLTSSQLKPVRSLLEGYFEGAEPFSHDQLSTQKIPSVPSRVSEKAIEGFYLEPDRFAGVYEPGKFTSLLKFLLPQIDKFVSGSDTGSEAPDPIFNALFLLRRSVLAFNGEAASIRLIDRFEDVSQAQGLVRSLVNLVSCIELRCHEAINLYFESLCTLVEILSEELNHLNSNGSRVGGFDLYRLFYNLDGDTIHAFCRRLIYAFVTPISLPSSGVISGAFSYMFSNPVPDPNTLAFLSLQLYLLLALHRAENVFIDALASLFDIKRASGYHFEPGKVYQVMVENLEDETALLMLYILMIHNQSFRDYVFCLTDPSELLVPLLRFMFLSSSDCENLYQLQIVGAIFLMCMEGKGLIKNLEQKIVQPYSWFQGRLFHQLPLSEFVVHVLVKIISTNLSEPRDQYMYSIAVTVLLNMAGCVSNLQASSVQKLFSLIELVNKKLIKLGQSNSIERVAKLQGISIYEELLFLLIEFIITNVKTKPSGSTHLIYALLQHKEFLTQFVSHPFLGSLAAVAIQVVEHFEKCIQTAEVAPNPTSAELSAVISVEVLAWQPTVLMGTCSHRFSYQPDSGRADYFKPLIWVSIGTRITSALNQEALYISMLKQWGY